MSEHFMQSVILAITVVVVTGACFWLWRWERHRQRSVDELPEDVIEFLKMHPATWDEIRRRKTISVAEVTDRLQGIQTILKDEIDRRDGKKRV